MYKLIYGKSEIKLKNRNNFPDNYIDVLISDIPYGVNINPAWDRGIPNEEIWNECYRILKPGAHCIIFGQPSMLHELINIMNNTEFDYRDMWVWKYQGTHTKGYKLEEKNNLYRSRIRNVFNSILVYRKKLEGTEQENWTKYHTNLLNIDNNRQMYKGNHKNIIEKFKKTGEKHLQSAVKSNTFKTMERKGWLPDPQGAEPVNVQYIPRAPQWERTIKGLVKNNHETVKPIKLMLWLVGLTTTTENQTVLDPFMGTGSTGCACKLLHRNFIGIDDDKNSVEIARKRIKHIHEIGPKLIDYQQKLF